MSIIVWLTKAKGGRAGITRIPDGNALSYLDLATMMKSPHA